MHFRHLSEALRFYNNNNPARQRFFNLFEVEHLGGENKAQDFSGESTRDVWASIQAGIAVALRYHKPKAQIAWGLHNIGPRDLQMHVHSIAAILGISRASCYRWLDAIDEDLEREFIRRELLEVASNNPSRK